MAIKTNIAWTKATINTAWGCHKVDTGPLGACTNCYMFRMSPGFGRDANNPELLDLEARKKDCRKLVRQGVDKVFLNSMSDTFLEDFSDELIEKWHTELIEAFPKLQFQVLTKRIGRAMMFYRKRPVPANAWIGCSIGQQSRLFRLEQLRKIDARIRWVSFEPLLEDLGDFSLEGIQWAVVGGESDLRSPRPMKAEWAANIKRICERNNVPWFFKQWGGKGKDGAGGDVWLDGKQHHNYPRWR